MANNQKSRWQRAIDSVKSFVTDKKDRSTTPPIYAIVASMTNADGVHWVRNGISGMQFSTYLLPSNVHREDITVILYEYLNGTFFVRNQAPMGGRRMYMVTEFVCNDGRTLWQQVDGDGRICHSSGLRETELRGLIERLDPEVWGNMCWVLRDGDNENA